MVAETLEEPTDKGELHRHRCRWGTRYDFGYEGDVEVVQGFVHLVKHVGDGRVTGIVGDGSLVPHERAQLSHLLHDSPAPWPQISAEVHRRLSRDVLRKVAAPLEFRDDSDDAHQILDLCRIQATNQQPAAYFVLERVIEAVDPFLAVDQQCGDRDVAVDQSLSCSDEAISHEGEKLENPGVDRWRPERLGHHCGKSRRVAASGWFFAAHVSVLSCRRHQPWKGAIDLIQRESLGGSIGTRAGVPPLRHVDVVTGYVEAASGDLG